MDASRSPESVFDALAARQLLIVSGKGGVGRTTVAALLGLALARRGRKVLVATVGLDDRLAWMLGLPTLHETAGWTPYDGLQVIGWPRTVLLRGKVIVDNQHYVGAPGDGRFGQRNAAAV